MPSVPRPTVAVVVTAHEREEYLDEALSSVRLQSEPPDELMVLTDRNSVSYVNGERSDSSFVHMGPKVAYALTHCRSDVVCLLEDDDLFEPSKVRSVRSFFGQYAHLTLLHHESSEFGEIPHRTWRHPTRPYGFIPHQLSALDRARVDDNASSICVRRSALEPVAEHLRRLNEIPDIALVWATLAVGGSIHSCPEVLCRRRWHGTNVSHDPATVERTKESLRYLLPVSKGVAHRYARSKLRFRQPGTISCLWDGVECLSVPRVRRALVSFVRAVA